MNYHGPCKGITKKGQPCRAVVVHENSFCRAHGGNGYPNRDRMLLERTIARSVRRQKKIDRWIAKAAKANPEFAATLERVRAAKKDKPEPTPLPRLMP
jgi:hypothetical protein